jgi:hypothetical protein
MADDFSCLASMKLVGGAAGGAAAVAGPAAVAGTKRPAAADGAQPSTCPAHQLPYREFITRKEGENKGRKFYKCSNADKACFVWDALPAPGAAPQAGGGGGGYRGGGGGFRSAAAAASLPPLSQQVVSYSKATAPTAAALPPLSEARKRQLARLFGLEVDAAESLLIQALPQRSEAWKLKRRGRITASNFGSAAGHNKYCSPDALLQELLWGEFKEGEHNAAMAWGTFMEALACAEYTAKRQREWVERIMPTLAVGAPLPHGITEMPFAVEHTGLYVNPAAPFLGVSFDGLVHTRDPATGESVTGVLEIKAPASKTLYSRQPAYANALFPGIPAGIPPYYYDQIQGAMALGGHAWADFCVWTPTEMEVKRYAFDEGYWSGTLYPALEKFYFERYLPALQLRDAGKLRRGELTPSLDV